MALSVFDDRAHEPQPDELRATLGRAHAAWARIVAHARANAAPLTERWSFAGPRFGWSLRLVRKDRVLLYLTPRPGSFLVGVVLGEKAAAAARAEGLPTALLAMIDAAPKYAEGRGIRIEATTAADAQNAERLLAIKLGSGGAARAPSKASRSPGRH